jgi:acyl carrier protein
MKTTDTVIEILKDLSAREEIKLTDELQSDLSLDSLGMVTMLIDIEDEFDIELQESDMNPFELETVEDVVALVEKYCGDENEKEN